MVRKGYVERICRSLFTRALSSFVLVGAVMTVGTVAMHYFEDLQGPPVAPATMAGKIFASIMAFISVGSIVAALGFLFGPFFGVILRMETERVEKEIQVHMLKRESHEKS